MNGATGMVLVVVAAVVSDGSVDVVLVDDEVVVVLSSRSWNSRAEVVLRLRGLDARAPQLVGDEAEHQQPECDEGATEDADEPAPVVRLLGPLEVRHPPALAHGA